MRPRTRLLVTGALGAALAFALPRAGRAASPNDAPAKIDRAETPATAIVLSRPFAHLDELMKLPRAAQLLQRPLAKQLIGGEDLNELYSMFARFPPYWPHELAVGLPSAAYTNLDVLGRVFMLAALCDGAKQAGAAAKTERPRLQKALLAELRRAQLPPLVVWADFRDQATARLVANLVSSALKPALASVKTSLITERDAVGVRLVVSSIFNARELKSMLVEFGWLTGPGDPQAAALTAAVAALRLEAWLEVRGSGLLLTWGPRFRGAPPAIDTTAGPPPIGQLVASARWEIAPLRRLVDGWLALWGTWEASAAGRTARAQDETDMLGDLDGLARLLPHSPDRGQAWLWADRGLHGLMEEDGGRQFVPLVSDPVTALLPANTVAIDVDARRNLGERLSDSFSRIEDRLALRSFRDLVGAGGEPTRNEERELAYYKHAAAVRELIHKQGPRLFDGGSALVVGPEERMSRLDVREAGKPPRTSKNLDTPALALIGRAKDAASAWRFAAEVWAALGTAAGSALGSPAPPHAILTPAPASASAPGAETRWLDTGWFESLNNTSIAAEGGFKPQVAILDNLVVISTSPRLTQRIFATRGAAAKDRLALPSATGPLVTWTRYPCAPLVGQLTHTLTTLEKLAGPLGFATRVRSLTDGLCEVVEGASWFATQQGNRLTTRFEMPAAAALYQDADGPR